jgi:hypothetical protein
MKKTVALLTLLVVLAGCGGGRPSADELATALGDRSNPAAVAFGGTGASAELLDCVAEALHDSDLSDRALRAIVDGDERYDRDERDADVLAGGELQQELAECLSG